MDFFEAGENQFFMKKLFYFGLLIFLWINIEPTLAQEVQVDLNLNVIHSVDNVSDFGRERHMIVHSTPTDADWIGEEDKRSYLIDDLNVYFGRDNGSATWKFNNTPADPNRPHYPDMEWMKTEALRLKKLYDEQNLAHQYEYKGPMIMGTNPHPTYPTLSWHTDGMTWTGWQPQDVETSVDWVVQYLDHYFQEHPGGSGEPMPTYWEVVNEIDMLMMTGHLTFTSIEQIWKYHNLVAKGVKERLGSKAPQVGGMTWGMHDFHMRDWVSRYPVSQALAWGVKEEAVATAFEPYMSDDWYQWDVMWQGFIDHCGENMDFYGVHIYDWPNWETPSSFIRSGGQTEALLDILEWYDLYKFGKRKDIILSEYGAVSGHYINNMPNADPKRRDWENLKPFNSMFMQFLERPSHIRLTMPFTPVKAHWGDHLNDDGSIKSRYPYKMLDANEQGEYEWTEYIKFFELWSDVEGTRVETKSSNLDVQVDCYVDGSHAYLILNNLSATAQDIALNYFDSQENTPTNVHVKYLYLDEQLGANGEPVLEDYNLSTAPGKFHLKGDGTVILDYQFSQSIALNESCKEYKFMGEKLGSGSTPAGGDKIHTTVSNGSLTAQVNNVSIPAGYAEARLRISGDFFTDHVGVPEITVNGHTVEYDGNVRGDLDKTGQNKWLGVLEVPVPMEYLAASNVITCKTTNTVEYATVMIQIWDFSNTPGRGDQQAVALAGISTAPSLSLMNGETKSVAVTFSPSNASNKNLTWTSSDNALATVNEFGQVTALADAGQVSITATSEDGQFTATVDLDLAPYTETAVSSISIDQGENLTVGYYVTTPLTATISPENATTQTVVWSSSDSTVSVDAATGKVNGLEIGQSAVITATVIDAVSQQQFTDQITVTVGIAGEEQIFCGGLPAAVNAHTEFIFELNANADVNRSVKLELTQGTQVLGSQQVSLTAAGKQSVSVPLSLTSLPSTGEYTLKATLLKSGTVLSTCEQALTILPAVEVSQLVFVDGLRQVLPNDQLPLEVQVLPEDAFDQAVSWSSSNVAVATVDAQGIVTGKAIGEATIRATSANGVFAEAVVSVVNEVMVEPTALVLPKQVTILPNGSYQAETAFIPEWTTDKAVQWQSSDPQALAVSPQGLITANAQQGTFTVTVSSTNQPSVNTSMQVTVGNILKIEAEEFDQMGGAVGEIAIYDIPSGGQGINNVQRGDFVSYEVYVPASGPYLVNFRAATGVEDGQIELLANETALLTVKVPTTSWEEFTNVAYAQTIQLNEGAYTLRLNGAGSSDWQWNLDYFTLTYQGEISCDPLTDIAFDEAQKTMAVGSQLTLNAQLSPANVCPTTLEWSSSNPAVAAVNAQGVVEALTAGVATIKASANGLEATVEITTTNQDIAVTEVNLTPATVSLSVGQQANLTATVLPENATNKTVSFLSDQPTIVSVNGEGLITALANGTANITVTTEDGGFTANTLVTVAESTGFVLEAETFESTGGTFDDGLVPFGVNATAIGINYVNSGDWASYTLNVPEGGQYSVHYSISTPENNAEITFELDGVVWKSTAVPNNGQWDDYSSPVQAEGWIELTQGNHQVRILATGSGDWQWNLDKVTFNYEAPIFNEPIAVTGVNLSASTLDLFVGAEETLIASVLPANATDQSVRWSSSSTLVATVDANGLVQAQAEGTATITVITNDGDFTANCEVTVSVPAASLRIEAEDFTATGGTHGGFEIYSSASGVQAVNFVQTGDWGEYSISVPTTGEYDITYHVGTGVTGAAISCLVDGQQAHKTTVPNNGNWDGFSDLAANGPVSLSAGTHTIRLLGDGTNGWEWNMDYWTLTPANAALRQFSAKDEEILVYPNPMKESLNIVKLPYGQKSISLVSVLGKIIKTVTTNQEQIKNWSVGRLPAGVYLLKIQLDGKTFKVIRLVKE